MSGSCLGLKRTIYCNRRKILFFVKLTVSLGLVVYLGWIVDWDRAVRTASEADIVLLIMVPCLLLARLGFAAFRWRLILADSELAFSFGEAYTDYLVGAFYNVLLPGVTGGDAVRIGRCVRRTECQLGTATASVLLERIGGIFALLNVALFDYLLFPAMSSSLLSTEETSSVTMVAAVGIVLMAAVTLGRRVWLRWLPHGDAGRVWRLIRQAVRTLGVLRGRTLGAVFVLSMLFQVIDIVATFFLSQAIGLAVPLAGFFAIIPLVYLVTFLPISLGGLGVREGMFVFLLAQFGVVASDAVALSFLLYLNRVVIAGLGGLVQLAQTLRNKKADRVAEYVESAGVPKQEQRQRYV